MYDPAVDGAVNAIRIYENPNGWQVMADLKFAFGGTVTIVWTDPTEREPYYKGMNGYTFIYDERTKKTPW